MIVNKYLRILEEIDESIAFILGFYHITELGLMRNLAKKNIPTIVLNPYLNPYTKIISFYSKYCQGIVCPHPRDNEEEYVEFLLNLGENLNSKGVLIPAADLIISPILKNRSKLEKYFIFPFANLEIVEKLLNKKIFYKTLDEFNIHHPKTHFPNDDSELKDISRNINYPCIIKPAYSGNFLSDFHTKILTARNKKELIQYYSKAHAKNHEVVIQDIIPGKVIHMRGFCAYYNKSFDPIGTFTYKRIREWPHGAGNSSLLESVKIPELEETVTYIIKKIKYYGFVEAEFKKDPRDGLNKLFEINPRPWRTISLPTKCGVNIPYLAYMDAIGKSVKKPLVQMKEGVKWVNIIVDVLSSFKSLREKELSLSDWIKSYRGEKEYAVFSWSDPLPFMEYFVNIVFGFVPY